jgi:hypothetical protein
VNEKSLEAMCLVSKRRVMAGEAHISVKNLIFHECQAVSTPTSYSGDPTFKSQPGDWLS